jgi:hypothetical protein
MGASNITVQAELIIWGLLEPVTNTYLESLSMFRRPIVQSEERTGCRISNKEEETHGIYRPGTRL